MKETDYIQPHNHVNFSSFILILKIHLALVKENYKKKSKLLSVYHQHLKLLFYLFAYLQH